MILAIVFMHGHQCTHTDQSQFFPTGHYRLVVLSADTMKVYLAVLFVYLHRITDIRTWCYTTSLHLNGVIADILYNIIAHTQS